MSGTKFKVVYEHDEGGWHVSIPAVKGCHTWGRSIGAARKNIREALATCSDLFRDPDRVAASAVFEEDIRLPSRAKSAIRDAQLAIQRRAASERDARARAAYAAKVLAEGGLSLRDSGDILGMSQEQVRQILRVAS